jgi:hypothetical protein
VSSRDIIIKRIANSFDRYEKGVLLSGILYLHRISDNKAGGVAIRNFSLFRKLCGAETLANVVIATTMWDKIDKATGKRREEELRSSPKLFKPAMEKGAMLARHNGTYESAHEILGSLLNQPTALRIQREIVDHKKELDQTDAGIELAKEQEQLEREHVKRMKEITEKLEKASEQRRKRYLMEFEETEGKLRVLHEERITMAANYRAEQERNRQLQKEQMRLLEASKRVQDERSHMLDLLAVWRQMSESQPTFRKSYVIRPRNFQSLTMS